MTHYLDMSPYTYHPAGVGVNTVNIGWLDAEYKFPLGKASDNFIELLWSLCKQPAVQTTGFHRCNLCLIPSVGQHEARRCGELLKLGSAEIRVFDSNGQEYAAPNLIYHYVVEHYYLPPSEFIEAVVKNRPKGIIPSRAFS